MAQAQSEVSAQSVIRRYENFVSEPHLAQLQPNVDDLVLDQPFLSDERRDSALALLILDFFEKVPEADLSTKESVLWMITAFHELVKSLLPEKIAEIQDNLEEQEAILADEELSLLEKRIANSYKTLYTELLEILTEQTQIGEALLAITAAIALLVQDTPEIAKDSEAAQAIDAFDDELERFFMPLAQALGYEKEGL